MDAFGVVGDDPAALGPCLPHGECADGMVGSEPGRTFAFYSDLDLRHLPASFLRAHGRGKRPVASMLTGCENTLFRTFSSFWIFHCMVADRPASACDGCGQRQFPRPADGKYRPDQGH